MRACPPSAKRIRACTRPVGTDTCSAATARRRSSGGGRDRRLVAGLVRCLSRASHGLGVTRCHWASYVVDEVGPDLRVLVESLAQVLGGLLPRVGDEAQGEALVELS